MYGEAVFTEIWWGNLRKVDPLENPGVDGNVKTDLQEVGWGIEWIDLARNRDEWQHLVNAVKKHLGSIKRGEFLAKLRTC